MSEDSQISLKRLEDKNIPIRTLQDDADLEDLSLIMKRATHVVDAIFGTGLVDKEIPASYNRIFDLVNDFDREKIAIDIPSGLRGDIGLTIGNGIFADKTIVIQNYKTGCLLNDGPDYTGDTILIDIGIDENSIPNEKYHTQESDLKFPQKRKRILINTITAQWL